MSLVGSLKHEHCIHSHTRFGARELKCLWLAVRNTHIAFTAIHGLEQGAETSITVIARPEPMTRHLLSLPVLTC